MVVANSSDISQHKIDDSFRGFDSNRAYIDAIFILTKENWEDHVQKLELTLNKPKGKGLKFNIKKSFSVQN